MFSYQSFLQYCSYSTFVTICLHTILCELISFRDVRTNFAFVMELVYTNYKITLDLIIGQIHDDMFISQHVAITSYEIVAHIDVFTVFEFPHRDLKEPLTPFVLILAINKTSNVLAWVGNDFNQTIVIVSTSSEK